MSLRATLLDLYLLLGVMPLKAEQRIRNQRSRRKDRQRCHWCGDCGYIVASTRRVEVRRFFGRDDRPVACAAQAMRAELVGEYQAEELAPCPFCEQGLAEEFADPESQTKAPPVRAPWGKDGFWKGREPVEIQPLEAEGTARLSREEQKAKLAELIAQVGFAAKPMTEKQAGAE